MYIFHFHLKLNDVLIVHVIGLPHIHLDTSDSLALDYIGLYKVTGDRNGRHLT